MIKTTIQAKKDSATYTISVLPRRPKNLNVGVLGTPCMTLSCQLSEGRERTVCSRATTVERGHSV